MVCWITTPPISEYSIVRPGVDSLEGTIPSTTESYFYVLTILQSSTYISVQSYLTIAELQEEGLCRLQHIWWPTPSCMRLCRNKNCGGLVCGGLAMQLFSTSNFSVPHPTSYIKPQGNKLCRYAMVVNASHVKESNWSPIRMILQAPALAHWTNPHAAWLDRR
jgi:hypothetical protein